MKILSSVIIALLVSTTTATKADSYIIGVEANEYLPFWQAKGGDYTGFGRDFLDMFAAYSGNEFQYRALPIKRCLNELLEGSVDAKFPSNAYWSQDEKVGHEIIYSDAIIPYIDGVLVLPANKGKGKDALGTLSTMIGFTPWAYLDDIESGNVKVSESTNMISALKKTISGRAGGVYFNPVAAQYQLKANGLGENALVFDPDLPHSESAYHLASIKHPKLVEDLNRFLVDKKSEIEALKGQYGLQ